MANLLEEEISDEDIDKIATAMPEWERLVRYLFDEDSDAKIVDIKRDHNEHHHEQKIALLTLWRQNKGLDATYDALIKALESMGDQKTADRVYDIKTGQQRQQKKHSLPSNTMSSNQLCYKVVLWSLPIVVLVCAILVIPYITTTNEDNEVNPSHGQVHNDHTGIRGSGGVIPKDENLLIHLKSISEFLQFCIYLGLEYNECNRIERKRRDIDDQIIEMLQKWLERDSRTWSDFIKPFIMLRKCTKAKELVEKYNVIFCDSKINEMCPTI